MPVYEYVCQDCNARFDARVASWRDADAVSCSQCQSNHLRRMISSFAHVGGNGHDLPMADVRPSSSGGCCGGSCGRA